MNSDWTAAFLHHHWTVTHCLSRDSKEAEPKESKLAQGKGRAPTKLKARISADLDQPTVPLFSYSCSSFLYSWVCIWTFSSPPHISAGMPGVRSSTILVLTALVLCIQTVSSQPDGDLDQNQDLDQELRRHQLLQRAHGAGLLSQVSHSHLFKSENFWWHTDTSELKQHRCFSHSLNWVTLLILLDGLGRDFIDQLKVVILLISHISFVIVLGFPRLRRAAAH